MNCKTCFITIPIQRFNLGYRICINCSNEPKWSSVPVINHKTGNEIQIIKDPEVAAEFLAKSARQGFGTLRGMSKSYKRITNTLEPQPPKLTPSQPPSDRVINRKQLPHQFESIGEKVMELIEAKDKKTALCLIDSSLQEKSIWKNQANQLRLIVESLCI